MVSPSARRVTYPQRWIRCSVGEHELAKVKAAIQQLPDHMAAGMAIPTSSFGESGSCGVMSKPT